MVAYSRCDLARPALRNSAYAYGGMAKRRIRTLTPRRKPAAATAERRWHAAARVAEPGRAPAASQSGIG
jgi:hypothetical protein